MRHLTHAELLAELARRPGLIPVALDISARQVEWLDVEKYHFYEGFLHKSLARFAALKNLKHKSAAAFTTDFAALDDLAILRDALYPTGFIFHAGRSGSTLLSRVLARSRRHLVLSEAAAHNQIWLALTNDGATSLTASEENQRFYKHLLLATGRRRVPNYAGHYIKFTSFNILFYAFIRCIFPDVPTLFLYREPSRILASFERQPVEWLDSGQPNLKKIMLEAARNTDEAAALETPAQALNLLLAAGLRAGENGARFLRYDQLSAANLPDILAFFKVAVAPAELTLMQSQFDLDSKSEHRAERFIADSLTQNAPIIETGMSEKLNQLYDSLSASAANLLSTEDSSPQI